MSEAPSNASAPPVPEEVRCKTILSESGICDYALNCYTGCAHACAYCYARFMGRFHHPGKAWGSFVDAKVNAPEVLARQLQGRRLFSPGSVFVSSVCDGYQPAEETFQLTRRCLAMLVEAGFSVHVQTKSALVRRDFDLLAKAANVSLCQTITTLDEELAAQTEPLAAAPSARLETLRRAAEAGIPVKVFVGPLLPGLSDTAESLRAVFSALAKLDLAEVYVDRLNLRWGVWPALRQTLEQIAPAAVTDTRAMLFEASRSRAYNRLLRQRVRQCADAAGLAAPLTMAV